MDVTPRLKLPFMGTDQLQKELTFNELAAMIDTLLHANVIDKDLTAPPASPADGDTYIIGAAPTGAWAGKAKYLAYYIGGWHYLAPQDGWLVWVADESKYYRYSGGAWAATLVTPIDLLASLTDVNTGVLDASKDGLALTYDHDTGKFVLSAVASLFASLGDVDVSGITAGQTIVWDAGSSKFVAADTAAGSFIGQGDTPDAYAGNAGKLVAVNETEDGLVFVEVDLGADPVTTLLGLDDTPDTFAGNAGKVLIVNPTEDGTLFEDPAVLSEGVPAGGLTDQLLRKTSDADFETEWVDPADLGLGLPALTGNAHKFLAVSGDESTSEWVPLDTDGTMAANSDTVIPSQKAVKTLVTTLVNALVAAAPGALDTLDELAAALGDDANFASTVTAALAGKVAKAGDTMTGALSVPDDAYGAGWNGSSEVPTKNAVYDKIEAMLLAGGYTDENARDAIGAALQNGTAIVITVNDAGDQITIGVDTAVIDERARDAVGAALVSTTGIDFVLDDAGDTIGLTVDPSEVEATDTEMWTGSSSTKIVTPKKVWDAAVTVALVDGANIAIDGNTGVNFKVTLGGNRTLDNPTNMKTGQSGIIIVTQDATGSRTLAYGSNWRFPGGAASGGVLSTTANAIDVISYYVRSDGTILANIGKDYKA